MSGTEDKLREHLAKTYTPKDRFYPWFIVITACVFTAVTIARSLRQGQLSVPITYDDIIYFVDAAHRLQILDDNGIWSFLRNLFAEPAHAPIATLIPFLGFALFGIHDWAPAVVNVVWVALILIFVRLLLADLPRWAFVAIALSVLAWPLTGAIVIESRPDIFASLLTVMGCTLMFRSSLLQAPTRHVVLVAALFGVALVAKPSISPVTLVIYCASLAISIFIDWRLSFDRAFFRTAVLRVFESLTVTIIVALPYFAFAWRDTYIYIYTTTMGKDRALWQVRQGAFDTAGYYLWGTGGQIMMGAWFWVTILLIGIAIILSLVTKRAINQRNIGLLTVFLAAYALVTIPPTKSAFLGVIVSTFFLAFYVIAAGHIVEVLLRSRSYGKLASIGFAAGLLVISASIFRWHTINWQWNDGLGVPHTEQAHLLSGRRYELIRRFANYFEVHAGEYTKDSFFFPVLTMYFNPSILQFELQKRGLENTHIISTPTSLTAQRAALAKADNVLLFDEDDPEILRWSPNKAFYGQMRALVVNDRAFTKALEVPTADLIHKISLYRRVHLLHPRPFYNLRPISGFLPLEGPYPQWHLPYVRWAIGQSARAKFAQLQGGAGRLILRAQSPLADQSIEIRFDGKYAGTCHLPAANVLVDCSFPVTVPQAQPSIELQFSKSGLAKNGMRSVLFTELRLEYGN